jgi:hypothetical protein
LLSQCSSASWTDSSVRPPAPGQVGRRIYEENGHRYLEERRIISVNPYEAVVTTTQLADRPPPLL